MEDGITIEECIRLVEHDISYEGKVKGLGDVQTAMDIVSVWGDFNSIVGGLKYTRPIWGNVGGFWRGSSRGKNANTYYRSSQALSRGGAVRNVAYKTGMDAARNVQYFKVLRVLGNVGSVVTTFHSAYQFEQNRNWQDAVNVVLGIGGLIYWPIGVAHTYYTVLVPVMLESISQEQIERARRLSEGDRSAMWMTRGMARR